MPAKKVSVIKVEKRPTEVFNKTDHAERENIISDGASYERDAEKKLEETTIKDGNLTRPTSLSSSPTPGRSSARTQSARLAKEKTVSPFLKFRQLETGNERLSSSPPTPSIMTSLCRNSSLPPSPRPTITHAQMSSGTAPGRVGSGAKEIILGWVQQTIQDYLTVQD